MLFYPCYICYFIRAIFVVLSLLYLFFCPFYICCFTLLYLLFYRRCFCDFIVAIVVLLFWCCCCCFTVCLLSLFFFFFYRFPLKAFFLKSRFLSFASGPKQELLRFFPSAFPDQPVVTGIALSSHCRRYIVPVGPVQPVWPV